MEFDTVIWIAQAAGKAGAGGMLVQLVPFAIIFVLFWFLIIRPQRKREREHQEMLNVLKKGDKVVTNSGIFGEVYSVTPQTAVIEIAHKTKITIQRGAIAALVDSEQFAQLQQHVPASSKDSGDSGGKDRAKNRKSLKKKKK